MPPVSTAFAKNVVRRALMQVADPAPDRRQQLLIWEFFASACAYCGRVVSKESKEGHIDHLVSASLGGRNHIANRVLSCAPCNEKEKRDAPWEDFLRVKCSDDLVHGERRARIEEWQRLNALEDTEAAATLRALAEISATDAHRLFDEKVVLIRESRRAQEKAEQRMVPPVLLAGGAEAKRLPRARYPFTRLCFKADLIEPLSPTDEFRVDTPIGSFQMSKQEFYDIFANVAASSSYRDAGLYHYTKVPEKALRFLVIDAPAI
jgi:hypothetical protein